MLGLASRAKNTTTYLESSPERIAKVMEDSQKARTAKAVRRTVRDLLAQYRKGTPERKQTEAVIAKWLQKL